MAETQDSDLHQHRRWRDIRHLLSLCQLDAPVKQRALAIFELLAEAEAKVHGCAVDEVVFHEVGAWDSIADIVAAAWLIERSGATSNAISEIQPSDRIPADVGHGRASDRTARSHCDDVPGDGHFFCTPYGANIRTHRMILLSNNIAVSLLLQ